jgi:hypothetical protein
MLARIGRAGGAWLMGREARAAAAAAAGGGRGAARGRVKRGGRGGAPPDTVIDLVGIGGELVRTVSPGICPGSNIGALIIVFGRDLCE